MCLTTHHTLCHPSHIVRCLYPPPFVCVFCSLASEADGVGFPLLVKAVAGGGGKGMKIAFKKVSGRPAAAFQQPSCC